MNEEEQNEEGCCAVCGTKVWYEPDQDPKFVTCEDKRCIAAMTRHQCG